jgi:DNA-binding NtrC family response regulator
MNERIIIAEDDADMRELLEEVLTDAGYKTIMAANGRFALAHVENEQEQIDLVLTDVQMPELKGDELLAKVRQTRAETPVVVITAFGSVENAVEMVKRGAYSYLTKPFATKDLLKLSAPRWHNRSRPRSSQPAPRDSGGEQSNNWRVAPDARIARHHQSRRTRFEQHFNYRRIRHGQRTRRPRRSRRFRPKQKRFRRCQLRRDSCRIG